MGLSWFPTAKAKSGKTLNHPLSAWPPRHRSPLDGKGRLQQPRGPRSWRGDGGHPGRRSTSGRR
eukprot:8949351-Alexandrium_andersonii.AAC.1